MNAETWTDKPCSICGHQAENENCNHHIYRKGSRPDLRFKAWNLMPVCGFCHGLIHSSTASDNKERKLMKLAKHWLELNGWEYDSSEKARGGWSHPKAVKAAMSKIAGSHE